MKKSWLVINLKKYLILQNRRLQNKLDFHQLLKGKQYTTLHISLQWCLC